MALAAASAGVHAGTTAEAVPLSKEDRAALIQQIVAGERNVTLLISASSSSVADAVRGLGGTVQHRDDRVGYLRVSVPVGAADDVARLSGVTAVDVDRLIQMPNPRPQEVGQDADPPGPGSPPENPYMPTKDIGAPQFRAANPTYDGRGVTIGIIDGGVDLLAPELQTAKKEDGKEVPKIKDWVNFNHPVTDNDPTWINMATQVKGRNGTFVVGGTTYQTPRGQGGSNFRFGLFNENSMLGGVSEWGNGACPASAPRGDVDRDGVCGESIALLWDGDDKVWVDTNQDRSFANEKMMEQFSKNRDFGILGTNNPATPVRETVPFTVQADEKSNRVNLGIVSSAHGTHVAGIAAGKDFMGGVWDGVAPEAQIVSVNVCVPQGGCTFNGLIEGMIYAIADAKSDVTNMSIGGLAALNDGNSVFAETYKRLLKDHNVQLFMSAGNSGPGFNTVGFPGDTDGVMNVGAYITKESFEANYSAITVLAEQLHPFSSRGPLENGAFKPNIIAPGNAVSTVPAWQAQQCLAPVVCPPGYGLFNGTSMASPQATGAAALLLTAAKFAGAEAKPWQLRLAMMSSARFIPTAAAHEQGAGIINVPAAWDLLKAKNFKEVDIVSRATVNTVLSDLLSPPNQGPGIYEREGWEPNETGTRQLTLTRTNGGQSDTYNLSWTGNEAGTFGPLPASVNLKNGPVTLNITISPKTSGVHSAILNVNDPTTGGIEYRILNTIVAAEQLTETTGWTATKNGSAARADRANFTFAVPESEIPQALRTVTDVTDGRIRVPRYHPWGVPIDNAVTAGFCTAGPPGVPANCDPIRQAVTNPASGAWELATEVSRSSAPELATFVQSASLISVSIDPAVWTVDPAPLNTPQSRLFTFTNHRASFTGGAVGTALGTASSARRTIAGGEAQVIPIPVGAGSTSLNVRIGNTSDTRADLDLFLFNPSFQQVAFSADGDSEEEVTVPNPVAGTWFAVVDGFSVPAGTTDYDYLDAIAHPSFGTITVNDPPALRAPGSSWSAMVSTTPLANPGAGRFLRGFVEVREGAAVLARAEVQLKNVS